MIKQKIKDFISLLLFNLYHNYNLLKTNNKPLYKLKLRDAGMFSCVNELIQHLHLSEKKKYEFSIDWENSCYKDSSKSIDPWKYYFKPCFNIEKNEEVLGELPIGRKIACSKNNIITPRISSGKCDPLLLPKNRFYVHEIINKYLFLNNDVQTIIDEFYKTNFDGYVIGVHIRGAGKNDGGVNKLIEKYTLKHGIPFKLYFDSIDETLNENPNSKIFICSDSKLVIDEVTNRYKEIVFTYDSTRSEFGEMHASHAQNKDNLYSKYKLGLDVIIEAYLLSRVNYLIHGVSNVTNFVLCNNPALKNRFVFSNNSL